MLFSSQKDGEELLVSESASMVDDQEEDDSWQYLVDLVSQEECNGLDPEASEQDDTEQEITGSSDDPTEDMVELLSVTCKKPMSTESWCLSIPDHH